jgi:hypothetical protein
MKLVEVRCCCQPQKLLGWLQVPEHRVKLGRVVRFHIPTTTIGLGLIDPPSLTDSVVVSLPVEMFKDGADMHLALKSEETPIDVLQRIPGFQRNDQP